LRTQQRSSKGELLKVVCSLTEKEGLTDFANASKRSGYFPNWLKYKSENVKT